VDDLRAALAIEVERIADRLRGLSQARLTEAVPGHASRADAARSTAQALADAAARIESEGAVEHHPEAGPEHPAPRLRSLPTLTAFAAGDQLAVTGHDLIAALGAVRGDAPEDESLAELAAAALGELRTLRRLL
jgi:hypothetical protein